MKFEHEVLFERGYDCIEFECIIDDPLCYPGSKESHGRSGMRIRWLVKGKKGAVEFLLSTNWLPIKKDQNIRNQNFRQEIPPMPTNLGYHSKKPLYKNQPSQSNCPYIGGTCYHGGNPSDADDAFYTLVNGGGKELWRFLDEYYMEIFHKKSYPKIIEYQKAKRKLTKTTEISSKLQFAKNEITSKIFERIEQQKKNNAETLIKRSNQARQLDL